MEEIKYKLLHGLPSTQENGLSRLRSAVSKKAQPVPESDPDLQALWAEVRRAEPGSAWRAAGALVQMVREGRLAVQGTMANFMAMAAQVQRPEGLILALGELLRMQIQMDKEATDKKTKAVPVGQYGIAHNQHPFISLLRSFPSCWPQIFAEIRDWLECSEPSEVPAVLLHLRPVFLFAFVDPHEHAHFGALRASLLDTIVALHAKSEAKESVEVLLWKIVTWSNFAEPATVLESARVALKVANVLKLDASFKVVQLCAISVRSAAVGLSPKHYLAQAATIAGGELDPTARNVCVLILSQAVPMLPSAHHPELLRLVLKLAGEGEAVHVLPLVLSCFAVAILQFLPNIQEVPKGMYADVKILLERMKAKKGNVLPSNNLFKLKNLCFDSLVREAGQSLKLMNSFETDEDCIRWLTGLKDSGLPDLSVAHDCLLALTLSSPSKEVVSASLDLLLTDASNPKSDVSQKILSVVMRRLSDKATLPEIHMALLHVLPPLGKDRCCLSLVLQVINSLNARPGLRPLRLHLLHELWLAEERVYPYLQRALEESAPASHALEFNIAKACTIRNVCMTKARERGADLLPMLSDLLNRCTDNSESSVATLALEGIAHLVRENVIDVRTTCQVLAPTLSEDHRVEVRVKFIEILGLVPTFDLDGQDYLDYRIATLSSLLQKVSSHPEQMPAELRGAYFKAISAFAFSDFTLKLLPSYCKSHLKFPAGYVAPEEGPPQEPEDLFQYISGDVWTSLLLNAPSEEVLRGYEMLLQKLMAAEVKELPRAVYYVSEAMRHKKEEPPSLNYLRETSILKSIVETFQNLLEGKTDVTQDRLDSLLRVLCQPLERPLPPFDWSPILRGLVEGGCVRSSEGRTLCYRLAVAQSETSRSARSFAKSLLTSSPACPFVALEVFSSFKALAHIPETLKIFLVSELRGDVEKVMCGIDVEEGRERFCKRIDSVRAALQALAATGGQDEYRTSLEQAMEILHEDIPEDENSEVLFDAVLNAVVFLQMKSLEKLALLPEKANVSPSNWKRILALRCRLASTPVANSSEAGSLVNSPLAWLNDALVAASRRSAEDQVQALDSLVQAFSKQRAKGEAACRQWILELMGQIRVLSRSQASSSENQLAFLFEAFAVALALFSEEDSLLSNRRETLVSHCLEILPLSVQGARGLGPQLAEWMMAFCVPAKNAAKQGEKMAPPGFASAKRSWPKCVKAMTDCFVAFKECEKYEEPTMWSRLVVIEK